MKILIQHDDECPLGTDGLRAYSEARDAFTSTPPEARRSQKDIEDLFMAEAELELRQKCTCGADAFLGRHSG